MMSLLCPRQLPCLAPAAAVPCPLALPPIYAYEKFLDLIIFGRTDFRISLSGAKFDEEADFDVRLAAGPPKPHQINENLTFRSENFAEKNFVASKNRKLQIFRNARCRSFAKIGAKFEG